MNLRRVTQRIQNKLTSEIPSLLSAELPSCIKCPNTALMILLYCRRSNKVSLGIPKTERHKMGERPFKHITHIQDNLPTESCINRVNLNMTQDTECQNQWLNKKQVGLPMKFPI